MIHQTIYAIFLYFNIWILLLFLLLSYQFFNILIFSYLIIYSWMWFISGFSIFGPDCFQRNKTYLILIMALFTLGSIFSLCYAIYFSLYWDFTKLKFWNPDYEDVIGTFRIFLVIFNLIPVIHEILYFSVHMHRKRISLRGNINKFMVK